eukprot:scaffold4525_cov126-Skeletonema_dohrnii-CCMP3373.AAC.7
MSSAQEENIELKKELKQVLKLMSKMEANKQELDYKLAAEQQSNEVLQDDIASLKEDNEALKNDLKVANTAVEVMKSSDEYLHSSNADDVHSLMEQNTALSNSVEELKEEVASAQEMIALKTQEVVDLTSDLKVATKVMVNMQSNDIDWKQQLEDEMAKIKALEGEKASLEEEKATLSESVEALKKEKAIAEELAEAQMETAAQTKKDLAAAQKMIEKIQSDESEATKDVIARYEENLKTQQERVEELEQELVEAEEEMAEMKSNEDELSTQLGKVFIRINVLLDQIDEKEETISILQETNQQLMSRRPPRVASSMRDASELMGEEVDMLKEKRMSPAKNIRRVNSRSSIKPPASPASPVSRTRVRREGRMSFDNYEIEVDQEN